ncbi:flagellin [uncultured Kushneria sp.]|uniref:flagellin N-terminal helical domain-containing protein n=1 Tax=uncultured Kushneria sp. TaxID=905033 RepID=UPI002634346C|nr:flagellin [uncultured Kushneria sp.]
MFSISSSRSLPISNQLDKSQRSLNQAIERLSSGLRVNSAKDDAAGLAIANRFQANLNADMQITRGVNDGVSLIQTADGGLENINGLLQRARQLAVQASTETLADSDRAALQQEFTQLRAEIDRVANDTTIFGKTPLAPATPQPLPVKLGDTPPASEVLEPQFRPYASGVKSVAYIPVGTQNFRLEMDSLAYDDDIQLFTTDGRHLIGTPITGENTDHVWQHQKIESEADADRLLMNSSEGFKQNAHYDSSGLQDGTGQYDTTHLPVTVNYNGMQIHWSGDGDRQYPETAGQSGSGFNNGRIDDNKSQLEVLTIDEVTEDLLIFVVGEGNFNASATWDHMPLEYTPPPPPTGPVSIDTDIVVGADFGSDLQKITIRATPSDSKTLGLEDTGLDPAEKARAALGDLDRAMDRISEYRGSYGALQNRLEDVTETVADKQVITADALSRIMDADYAVEVSNMSRVQITQQAGTAVLAQANQRLDSVLALLR